MADQNPQTTSTQARDPSKPLVTLYWLEQSRSQRILWLLEALNIQYDLKIFHRNPRTRLAPPELKEIHPLGKSPVISVLPAHAGPEDKPVVIAESANIIEYLLEHFGGETSGLLPKRWREGKEGQVGGESEEWLRYRYFMHYAEGSLMTLIMVVVVNAGIKNSPVPFFIRPVTNGISSKIQSSFIDPSFATHFTFLEQQMATSPNNGQYLCGEKLTGADMLMSFPLIAAKGRIGLTADKYPLLAKYVDLLEQDAGYIKATEKIVEIEGKFEPLMKL